MQCDTCVRWPNLIGGKRVVKGHGSVVADVARKRSRYMPRLNSPTRRKLRSQRERPFSLPH